MPRPSTTTRARTSAFTVFTWLWIAALLVDRAKRAGPELNNLVVVAPALALLAFPTSRLAWLALAITQIATWWPGDSSQILWYVTGSFHLVVLITLGGLLLRNRGHPPTVSRLYDALSAPAAALLVICMSAAGWAKLNRDFLTPEISCGAVYYLWIAENPLLGWLPRTIAAQQIAVWIAVVGECLGPPLVLIRRTRTIGLLLLAAVWGGLAMCMHSHYFEFAGLFVALAVLLVPPAWLHSGRIAISWRLRRWPIAPRRRSLVRAAIRGVAVVFMATLVLGSAWGLDRLVLLEIYRWLVITAWSLLLLGCIANARRYPWRWPSIRRRATVHAAWIVPALVLLNEASPYVGLKHRPSMTMAANLRLSPLDSNHLVVDPVPTIPWSRPVTIIRSDLATLRPRERMSWLRFVGLLAEHPGATVTVQIADEPPRRLSIDDATHAGWLRWLARNLHLPRYPRGRARRKICDKPPPGLTALQWRKLARQRLREAAIRDEL